MGAPLGARAQQAGPAEFVFRGGKVLTMSGNRVAEAVAVAGGRITYVGSDSGAGAFVGAGTEVVELRGRTLMPGIHDGHMHPLSGGISLTKPTLNYRQLDLKEFVEGDPQAARAYVRPGARRLAVRRPVGPVRHGPPAHEGGPRSPADEEADPRHRPERPHGGGELARARARRHQGVHAGPAGRQDQARPPARADRDPVRQRHHTRIPEGPVAHDSAERGRAPGRSRRDRQEGNHLVPRRLGRRARARRRWPPSPTAVR